MLLGSPSITLKLRELLLSKFAFGVIELTENIAFPTFPCRSMPEVWIVFISFANFSARLLISLWTDPIKP